MNFQLLDFSFCLNLEESRSKVYVYYIKWPNEIYKFKEAPFSINNYRYTTKVISININIIPINKEGRGEGEGISEFNEGIVVSSIY